MVAFQRKPLLGKVFHHWVEYTLPRGSFQTPVLLSLWDCHQALLALACYLQLFPACKNKSFSSQIRLQHPREHFGVRVSVNGNPWTQAGPRSFGQPRGSITQGIRDIGGKKDRVVCQSKPLLGLVFQHWMIIVCQYADSWLFFFFFCRVYEINIKHWWP